MVEKWWVCPKCMWIPKTKEEQSTICPKCSAECVKRDFVTDQRDVEAWHEDLRRESGISKPRRPTDENLQ